jgi:hypothetical protein
MILDTNAISALAGEDKVLTDLVQAAPRYLQMIAG